MIKTCDAELLKIPTRYSGSDRTLMSPQPKYRAISDNRYTWDKDVIFVSFINGDEDQKMRVRDAATQYEDVCGIKFMWLDHGVAPGDVRISLMPGNSWSYIGKASREISNFAATMQLGWITSDMPDDEIKRVVLHEFGHALGLEHEHSHPLLDIPWDREAVYKYYAEQGWSPSYIEYNVLRKLEPNGLTYTEPDLESIMMYPIPRELLTDPSYEVGWNMDLSPKDKEFLARLYPKK